MQEEKLKAPDDTSDKSNVLLSMSPSQEPDSLLAADFYNASVKLLNLKTGAVRTLFKAAPFYKHSRKFTF